MSQPRKKYECDSCNKKFAIHGLVFIKGKQLCKNCRNKLKTAKIQESAQTNGRGYIKLEDVLKKTYTIKTYGNCICILNLPMCTAGKKFKLVLVDE